MDKAKKKRTAHRAAFTKALNTLSESLVNESPDKKQIMIEFALLEEKMHDLNGSSEAVMELFFASAEVSDETVESEIADTDEYKKKFLKAKASVEEFTSPTPDEMSQISSQGNVTVIHSEVQNSFKLPKIELFKFGGDIKEWLLFWSLFEKIHKDQKMELDLKYQYLIQSIVPNSPAAELVYSYPPTAANYENVIESLKDRFGRTDILIEVYVRELLQLILQNALKTSKKMPLSTLYDKIESHLRNLKTLGVTTDECGAMLFPLVESSLPEEMLRVWQRSDAAREETETIPGGPNIRCKDRLNRLMAFLRAEVRNEVRVAMALNGFTLNKDSSGSGKKTKALDEQSDIPSAASLLTTDRKKRGCIFCDSDAHKSYECEKAEELSLEEKKKIVRDKRACFYCLAVGHSYTRCRMFVKCGLCTRRHMDTMCPGGEESRKNEDPSLSCSNEVDGTVKKSLANYCGSAGIENYTTMSNLSQDPEVYIQTLRVKLVNGDREMIVRAVLDNGSQRSYITKEAANMMKYKAVGEQLLCHSLFGGVNSDTVKHKKYSIQLKSLFGDFTCRMDVLDENLICDKVPTVTDGIWIRELDKMNIKLTDVCSADKISILIGSNIVGRLLTGRKRDLKCGLTAIETHLGWTLLGEVPDSEERSDVAAIATSMFVNTHKIADLWSLDLLGIKDPIESKSRKEYEKEVSENFLKTVAINSEGRYEVNLPWRENHPALNDNKETAELRLDSTLKKLERDGVFNEYAAIFNEWIDEGIIERVPDCEKNNWGRYLPHRAVIKEGSTTRVRPVFDASAKDRNFPSLNDCLEKGPNLIELAPAIFLRFRINKIGVISDIKKAFLQISIHPDDRDVLRFLWVDQQGKIVMLRHCRVVFGVTCSPFILMMIIFLHLEKLLESLKDQPNSDSLIANIKRLKESYYVDNCATSVNSLDELRDFMSDAKGVMESAGFDLRGWEYTGDRDSSNANKTTVLGINWDKCADTLSLKLPETSELVGSKITRRIILSVTHRLFDPLGFASPVSLRPRLLLQQICEQSPSWDDEVDENVKKEFLAWVESLNGLDKLQVPRCIIGEINQGDRVSIHTFCDASKLAYAAVCFVRIESKSGVKVSFLQAKSRVAPKIKSGRTARHSIPRLELLAATIGVRLTAEILDSLKMENLEVFYWSDSSTVLAWIQRECNWSLFVWNRVVKEILKFTRAEQWRHIPGEFNPADLPSRGCTVDQLIASRWWKGPGWLQLESGKWPISAVKFNESEINAEMKKSNLKAEPNSIGLFTVDQDSNAPWYRNRYSSYNKILRVSAYLLRFIHNARETDLRISGFLTPSELNRSETLLLKSIQKESRIHEKDPRIEHLSPFQDEQTLIRLKTKISLRNDTYDFKCPVILPGDHEISHLIIKQMHESLKHAGVEIVMGSLREKYWILGGRKAIRSVIKKCVSCQRHDAKPLTAPPAPLPLNRVRDAAVFEVIGVDFAGPIFLKGGEKVWVCLFTCAVFRAVHLELVESLSTLAFLMALRRFIARRGRPSVVYSDNGTNFVGLSNCLKRIDFNVVAEHVATKEIEWRFNPPTAAWWGGFWERLIGILKRLLRRTLRRACLGYVELLTVLLDCESVINSRPISFLSEKDHEIAPLTPSLFLQEIKEIGVPDLDQIENHQLNKRYEYRQKIRDDLRSRFRREYLGSLMNRKLKLKNDHEIHVDDVVFVETENDKRINWPLARVKSVIVGNDGRVRVVRLVTANGELVRPIQRVYPLEIAYNDYGSELRKVVVGKCRRAGCKIVEPSVMPNVSHSKDRKNDERDERTIVTRKGRKINKPDRLTYA